MRQARLCRMRLSEMRRSDGNKAAFASSEQISRSVANFSDPEAVASFFQLLPAFDVNGLVNGHRILVFDGHFGSDSPFIDEARELTHRFIENHGDDASVSEARAAGVVRPENERTPGTAGVEIEVERELHPGGIRCTATEAAVGGLGCEFDDVGHTAEFAPFFPSALGQV